MTATYGGDRRLIVMLHSGHPNDFTSAKISRQSFASLGFEMLNVNVDAPDGVQSLVDTINARSAELFCFISANYYGAKVRAGKALLHTVTGIPLVIQQHDHAAFFLANQEPALDGTITFAADEPCARFCEQRLGIATEAVANVGSVAYFEESPQPPDFDDFIGRTNAIFAPMSVVIAGHDITGTWRDLDQDAWWARITALPPERRRRAIALAEAADESTDPITELDDRLFGVPKSETLAVRNADLPVVISFLKLRRRMRLLRALIDLPVVFTGPHVPSELQWKSRWRFMTVDMEQTLPLYRRYRFVLNASPLLHALHDRVTNALFSNSVVVTDRNRLLDRLFVGDRDVVFYDLSHRDTAERLARYLEDPDAAFAVTASAYDVRLASDFAISAYRELVSTVARRWEAVTAAPTVS